MVDTQQISPGQVEKILTKSVKQAIAQSNIISTRSGNKELSFLIKEVVSAPFDSESDVQRAGVALGQKIAQLLQQSDQKNLDAGVMRKLRFRQDWSAEFDIPEAPLTEKTAKKARKSAQTVVNMPAKETTHKETAEPTTPEPEVGGTSAVETVELTAEEETETGKNIAEENTAAESADASVMAESEEDITMPNQSPENVSEAAIAPETAAVSPQSPEADALLSEESDETSAMSSDPAESGLSEEASAIPEAAEAEVIEKVNSGAPGAGANTSAPVNPGAAALSNTEPTASDDKE